MAATTGNDLPQFAMRTGDEPGMSVAGLHQILSKNRYALLGWHVVLEPL
ncbi:MULTISPECIES: hypothetical protein [unclassified Novosphingobium]|nr:MULTISPECIES: hypothetical protein [unclassified Novosphingobium]NMN86877.1 hypothetical protein [Novosphingobium sp. SG916]